MPFFVAQVMNMVLPLHPHVGAMGVVVAKHRKVHE